MDINKSDWIWSSVSDISLVNKPGFVFVLILMTGNGSSFSRSKGHLLELGMLCFDQNI